MKKKLSKENIEDLYKFTRQHYVEHYDVQTELVDHLANDIEEIWVAQPQLSFQQARDKSFKKFGIFGFMDVVEAKQKQMHKKYWKIIWKFSKEWFQLPKIISTIIIFLLFFLLFQLPYSEYIFLTIIFFLITLEMVILFKARKEHKIKQEKKEKIFLFEAMIGNTRNGYTGFALLNLFNLINLTRFDFSNLTIYWIIFISLVITLLCVLFYVTNYVIPQKSEELLLETYPEYKIVNSL